MKVLLDECLPRKLKLHLSGHDVSTVPENGWAGIKNGALLRLMEPVFEVFITIDGNMQYQQNLNTVEIGVIVLVAPDNTMDTLQSLAPQILQALDGIQPGQVVKVSAIL
jgi:hypothetical protein